MKKYAILGVFWLFLMILIGLSINALPYNIDTTNASIGIFQYYDNETLTKSITDLKWTLATSTALTTDVFYNSSTGKSFNLTPGGNTLTLTWANLWGIMNMGVTNFSVEFDYYFNFTQPANQAILSVFTNLGNTKQTFLTFSSTECGAGKWGYYDTGNKCLEVTKDYKYNVWEHLKYTCISNSTCQIQFNNNGTWINLGSRTDGAVGPNQAVAIFPTNSAVKNLFIDNFVAYKGNEIPKTSAPAGFSYSQNLTYYKPYNTNISHWNQTFLYDLKANAEVKNCSLYINNILNKTNATITANKLIKEFYTDSEEEDFTSTGVYYWFNNSKYFIYGVNFTYLKNSGLSSLCVNTTFFYNNSKNFYRNTFCEDPGITYRLNYTFNISGFIADSVKIEVYPTGAGGEVHFKDLAIKGYELNSFNTSFLNSGNYNYSVNCYNNESTLFTNGYSYFSIPYYPLSLSILSVDLDPFINGMNINNNFSLIKAQITGNTDNLPYSIGLSVKNGSSLIGSSNALNITILNGSLYFGIINITLNISDYDNTGSILKQYFYLNDTENPYCSNAIDNYVNSGSQYFFNIACNDNMNFFLFNISCDSGYYGGAYSYFADNINQLTYIFNQSVNITNDLLCNIEYCDGHTANDLGYYDIEKVSDRQIDFKFNSKDINSVYTADSSLITTKELTDRITFKIDFTNKTKGISQRKIYYKASENSYYIPSDKYSAWIIDSDSRTWFDLNLNTKEKLSTKVFYLGSGLWEITLYTDKNIFEFETIGKLNCVKDSFTIHSVVNTAINILNFEFTQINTWIYFIFIIFYIALLFMAFTFKNFMIGSFAFIIGILLAFMSLGISVILTIAFFFINIILFITFGKFTNS